MTLQRFDGRVAVVTGAGGGLGRTYALELARRGARVVVNDLHNSESVVAEIAALGGQAIASGESVATRSGGQAIVERALDGFGRIDILISNAGILRSGRLDEQDDAAIDPVIDVHLKGSFYVCQPAFAAMKRQRSGRILLTASSSGVFGHPWQASYAAAKAGIVGLANTVALEGKDYGVLCNVILPSAVTEMNKEMDFSWASEVSEVGRVLKELAATRIDGPDRLDPVWVAPLALYLVSDTCGETQGIFSACSGRFARVVIEVGEGWTAPVQPSVEDVAAHWQTITGNARMTEPHSVYDEALGARRALKRLLDQ